MSFYGKGAHYFCREPGITSWSIGGLTMNIGRRVAPTVWKTNYLRLTLTYDLKQCFN